MTEAANDRRKQTVATAAQTVFTYDFKINASSELVITKRAAADDAISLLVEGGGNDYTVTGVGDAAGGTFVLNSGATEDDIYTAEAATVITREANYSSDLRAATLNADFDEAYRILNETRRKVDRSIRMPVDDNDGDVTGADMILPLAPARANMALVFDADGKLSVSSVAGFPSAITGAALSYLRVNAGATAYEHRTAVETRSDLGLGSMALQASGAVTITGGALSGVTLNNSVIGGTTPAAATFTTATATTLAAMTLGVSGVASFSAGTAAAPSLTFTGDANCGIYRSGADNIGFAANGVRQVNISGPASAVNYWDFSGNITTGGIRIKTEGSDANVSGFLNTKGTGASWFFNHGSDTNRSLVLSASASAVNHIGITGANSGSPPLIAATGVDANINMDLRGKGVGRVRIADSAGVLKFTANSTGIAFFAATEVAKGTITGSRGGNAALASLLTYLASTGILTDSSS